MVQETRIAIAGTRGHYAAALGELGAIESLKVVGICPAGDSVEPLVRWCRESDRDARVFDSYEGMLEEGRPELVVVCGPFESHTSMSVAAIERGIHVISEKPAALTVEQLSLLSQACRRRPEVLVAGMMFSRYSAGFVTARRLIEEGVLGELRLIDTRKSYKLGTRPEYYRRRATYGGTIPWVGSHAVDWILHLTGGGNAFGSVYARHSAKDNGGNGTMETSATCHFEMEGDLLATVSIDYLRPAGANTHGDDWARVVGTTGTMEVRPDLVAVITGGGSQQVELRSERTLVGDVVNYIRNKTAPLITTQSTLALTDACLRALRSADEGRVVRFDQ